MLTIQESFKRFRQHFNLSQTDLARVLGVRLSSYKYELKSVRGRTRYPGGEMLIKLSEKFNVSTDYLLGLSDDPHPKK